MKSRLCRQSILLTAALALLALSSSASALIITGGPIYTLPGGGSCSVTSGTAPSVGSGVTVTCTLVALGSHSNVYLGVRNATNVNGASTDNTTISGSEIFGFSSTGGSTITYSSTTSMTGGCAVNFGGSNCATGTDTVTSTMTVVHTGGGGTVSVVSAGGNPADNGNGAIQRLFRLTSGSTFTFDVDIAVGHPDFTAGSQLCTVFDTDHATAGGGNCRSGVDLAFYYSDCGDGVPDSPEQCDQGTGVNGTAGSCCTTSCTYKTNGTACTDDGNQCTNDQCNGASAICQHPNKTNGTACTGNGAGECSGADTCQSGTCANNDVGPGTPCTDTSPPGSNDANQCLAAQCQGTGTCSQVYAPESDGTGCAEGNFCTLSDTCQSGACSAGGGNPCPGADGDGDCSETCADTGFEVGNCGGADPNGSACNDGLFCNGTDTCTGGGCVTNTGDPCVGPDGDTNCSESCNEGGDNCLAADPDGTLCRTGSGDSCDANETCSGGACPADDAPGNSGNLCRSGSGDSCDVDETCTGTPGATCPADDAPGNSGNLCRVGSGDSCDVDETCTGTPTAPCPADDAPGNAGNICNAGSGDLCDPDETCTGTPLATCPSDTIASSGTLCRAGSGDSCDVDETCTGVANAACPTDDAPGNSGNLCRAGSGDSCDVDETCTGTPGATCPADDAPGNAGNVCNAGSGDLCDPDETCTGTPTVPCPSDTISSSGTVCRAGSGDSCDVDETCSGTADDPCPADDAPGNTGVVCRFSSAGDMCDLTETCTGTPGATCPADDAPGNAGVECRADAGDCDVAEQCTGVPDESCPVDGFELSGTTCTDEGEVCTTDLCDGSGSCEHNPGNSGTSCRAPAGSCDAEELCNGILGTCPADLNVANGTSCADGDFCDGAEECQSGACTDTADPCPVLCDELNDMCTVACGDEPAVGCRTSAKSILLIKDQTDNSKDKLIFKFIKGQNTSQAEFGNPLSQTDYALCVYGMVAGSSVALLDPVVQSGGPNWSTISTKGYKYKDSLGTQSGIQKLILKGSTDAKTKILVKGRGALLPDLTSGLLPFQAANYPIVAQVTNSETGVCWEASYQPTNVKKNVVTQFKAKKQTP